MFSLTQFLIGWPLFWLGCIALVGWPLVQLLGQTANLRRMTGGVLILLAGAFAYGLCNQLAIAAEEAVAPTDSGVATPDASSGSLPAKAPTEKPAAEKPASELPTPEPPAASPAPEKKADEPLNTPIGETSRVVIPPGRPSWVEKPPVFEAGVQKIAVKSEPFARQDDALAALNAKLLLQTEDFIVQHLHDARARTLVRVDLNTIREKLIPAGNRYDEQIEVSIGPMYQSHALLEFGPEFQGEITQRWNALREESRLLQLGLVVCSIMLFVSVAFGYLRVDHATQGRQSSRLQFMAAAAILLIVGSGAAVARFWPWL